MSNPAGSACLALLLHALCEAIDRQCAAVDALVDELRQAPTRARVMDRVTDWPAWVRAEVDKGMCDLATLYARAKAAGYPWSRSDLALLLHAIREG